MHRPPCKILPKNQNAIEAKIEGFPGDAGKTRGKTRGKSSKKEAGRQGTEERKPEENKLCRSEYPCQKGATGGDGGRLNTSQKHSVIMGIYI